MSTKHRLPRKGTILSGAFLRNRLGTLIRQPVFWFITIWGHLAIVLGMLGFYYFEQGVNPKVHSLLDTLFWAVSTVTTVGQGEVFPITEGGKILGILMMIMGSVFLWSYAGLFASALVSPDLKIVEREIAGLERDVHRVEREIDLDEQSLRRLQHSIDELLEKRKGRR